MEKIDFVIPWVDSLDPKWIVEKNKYEKGDSGEIVSSAVDANGSFRYRPETDMLRYWFRGVESFAPWVNKIHFVTCGQKPDWLNENHPKLNLVKHTGFIPAKYLPTFNANTIEMNFHRIEGLAERFVYFNDDMFLLQSIESGFFFRNGLPVLINNLRYPADVGYFNWSRLVFNDYCIVNRSFDMDKSIWDNRKKWFNVSVLGYKRARRNFVCYLANRTLPVSTYGHLAQPHLKSTFEEIWNRHPDVLNATCMHKFRADDQVNQWLSVAWSQAKGSFYPAHEKSRGRHFDISPRSIAEIEIAIKQQQYPQICVNDSQHNTEPEKSSEIIIKAFDAILPNKSSFEIA